MTVLKEENQFSQSHQREQNTFPLLVLTVSAKDGIVLSLVLRGLLLLERLGRNELSPILINLNLLGDKQHPLQWVEIVGDEEGVRKLLMVGG